jgi:DNA-binding NarL/FixJ family response regulator
VIGEAVDGASALALARTLGPGLVLLDILLPDISGLSLAHSLAELPDPPAVVLTSSRSASDLGASLLDTPARGFISKNELTAHAIRTLIGTTA